MSNLMTVGYINNKKLLLKLNIEKEKILNKYKYFSSQEQKFSSQENFLVKKNLKITLNRKKR